VPAATPVGAASDHQVYLWRQTLQQEGHPVLYIARVDDVIVIEHQHYIVRAGAEIVDQRGKDRFDRWLGDCRSESARPPTSSAAVCRAPMR
jgi:hypothetical protein